MPLGNSNNCTLRSPFAQDCAHPSQEPYSVTRTITSKETAVLARKEARAKAKLAKAEAKAEERK